MNVCVGGTFDHFHKGHRLLLSTAFSTAGKQGKVFIGITSGEILSTKKDVSSFKKRKTIVEQYIKEKQYTRPYQIEPIKDKYGPALTEDFDAIVVSSETLLTAQEINLLRRKKGKQFLKIIEIPIVLADDDAPISSSRIRKKQITTEGKLLKKD
ncbi:MAG: pantetheine-phosphate adenylyltransferase [Thermoplasmatota archaeon]